MCLPGSGDGVEAAGIERMTAQEAKSGQPRPAEHAVLGDRLVRVIAAAGIEAARSRQERARREAVKIQDGEDQSLHSQARKCPARRSRSSKSRSASARP